MSNSRIVFESSSIDWDSLPPEDPLTITQEILAEIPTELHSAAVKKYHWFRTDYNKTNERGGHFVIRQPISPDPIDIENIHRDVVKVMIALRPNALRMNISFATFMEAEDESDLNARFSVRYASSNNYTLFNDAQFISSSKQKEDFLEAISYSAVSDHLKLACQSTKDRVLHVAAIMINAVKIDDSTQYGNGDRDQPEMLRKHNIFWPRDGFCMFQCILDYQNKQYARRYKSIRKKSMFLKKAKKYCFRANIDFKTFDGRVGINDFPKVEEVFSCSLLVFKYIESIENTMSLKCIYNSPNPTVFLLAYEDHLCRIRDMEKFTGKFRCPKCKHDFSRPDSFNRHDQTSCDESKPSYYNCSIGFRPKGTLEQEIRRVGIPFSGLTFDLFATWDIETLLVESSKNNTLGRHSVVCISVASNVPDFTEAKVFINFDSEMDLVYQFLDYTRQMCRRARTENLHTFSSILDQLDTKLNLLNESKTSEYNCIKSARTRLVKAINKLPVFGCWSSKFDVPACLNHILSYAQKNSEEIPYILKNGAKFILLEDEYIILRDIANIQACSLDAFIKCWGGAPAKLVFPFDLMTDRHFLDRCGPFPSIEEFRSKLKADQLPPQDIYDRSKSAYETLCHSRMDNYFRHYAKIDVEPFAHAISKMLEHFYSQFHINFLVDANTISAMAEIAMFSNIFPKTTVIMAPTKQTHDLHIKIRRSITGGYSAIHHKVEIRGMTSVWGSEYDSPLHEKTLGYDANSLYAGMLAGDLPTGIPTIWKLKKNHFVKDKSLFPNSSYSEIEYCLYTEFTTDDECLHAFNGGQSSFGKYRPDLYIPSQNRVVLFHGCYYHHHRRLDPDCQSNNTDPAEADEKIRKDKEAVEFYKAVGLSVDIVWECHWKDRVAQDPHIQQFLNDHVKIPFKYPIHKDKMLEILMKDEIYGLVEFTAHIDDEHKQFYKENIAPFFQTTTIELSQLSPIQQAQCEIAKIKKPRTQLISATKTLKPSLITTDLFRYLYDLPGFTLDSLTEVYQFKRAKPFANFIDKLVRMRREADSDPSQLPLGTVAKLTANSAYGRTLIDRSRFTETVFAAGQELSDKLKHPRLKTAYPLANSEFWELSTRKKSYNPTSCPVIGLAVLSNSKRVLLDFALFMINVFNAEKKQIKILSMDTDSCYFSVPTEDLDSIVPASKKEIYEKKKPAYFALHESQKRTPLLFKLEKSSSNFIGLSPKTYLAYEITSMEELVETKRILEEMGLYKGPADVKKLSWLIKDDEDAKRAMKGIPHSSALKLKSLSFLETLLTGTPTSTSFLQIRRDQKTKEVVTRSQERIALSPVSFKLYQISASNLETLY